MISDDDLRALLDEHAPRAPLALVPELDCYCAVDELPLWQALEARLGQRIDAPFYAVPWPGAQALARCLLDGVVDVKGKRTADLGCGSGLAAVAAAKAGAADVIAIDLDPLACATARLLARAHNVIVQTQQASFADAAEGDADVVVAGDVVYNAAAADALCACIKRARARGATLLIADSGRPFFRSEGLERVCSFDVAVPRSVEGVTTRTVTVYR